MPWSLKQWQNDCLFLTLPMAMHPVCARMTRALTSCATQVSARLQQIISSVVAKIDSLAPLVTIFNAFHFSTLSVRVGATKYWLKLTQNSLKLAFEELTSYNSGIGRFFFAPSWVILKASEIGWDYVAIKLPFDTRHKIKFCLYITSLLTHTVTTPETETEVHCK